MGGRTADGTGKFDAPECAGKQAYYVFAYDDSVSTLGPDVRVTTDSRREGDVLVARGLRGHGSAIRSTVAVSVHERKSQLTLLLGREENLNGRGGARRRTGGRAAGRGPGQPALRIPVLSREKTQGPLHPAVLPQHKERH